MRSPRPSLVLYLLLAAQQTVAGPLKLAGRGHGPSNSTSAVGGNATSAGIGLPGAGNLTSTRPAATTPHPQFQTLTGSPIDIPESLLTETLSEKVMELKTVTLIPIEETTTTTRHGNRTRTSSSPDALPTIPSLNTTHSLPSNSSHRTSERLTPTSAAPGITSLETHTSPRPTHNATLTIPGARSRNSTVTVITPTASPTSKSSREGSSTTTTTESSVFVPPVPTLPANQTRPANHTHSSTTSKTTGPASLTTTVPSPPSITSTSASTTPSATRTEPYYLTSEIPRPITVADPRSTLAPEDVYPHNLDQARRFNALYAGLAPGSLCTAGQVACIDGTVATCPATGAQFALSSCGWSNLRCFVLPLNHTAGVVVGCSDVAEADKILAPTASSSTTSMLPFLTTGLRTPATTPPPTTRAKNTTTARNTTTTSPTHQTSAAATTPSSTLSTTSPSHNTTTATPMPPKATATGVVLRPIPETVDPLASGLLKKVIVAPEQTVPSFLTVTVTKEHYVTVTAAPGV